MPERGITARLAPWMAAGAAALASLAAYGMLVEPSMLRVDRYAVEAGPGKAARIALLSDLHLPALIPLEDRIFAALEREHPDLVLVAGDVRNHAGGKNDPAHPAAAADTTDPPDLVFLKRLASRWPTVMVPGDADACGSRGQCLYCRYKYSLRRQPPFRILRNAWAEFPALNLAVYGADDPTTGLDRPDTLDTLPSKRLNLLLIHSSHALSERDIARFDLVMAGNTHGGQIRMPAFLLRRRDPTLDVSHLRGRFRFPKGELIVTSGTGTSVLPIRIGVPPEVVIIDIGRK